MPFTLALGDHSLYVAYTTEFHIGAPVSGVIRTAPSPYSLDDRGTTAIEQQRFKEPSLLLYAYI